MGTYQHHEARTSLLDGQKVNHPQYPQRAVSDERSPQKLTRPMNNRFFPTGGGDVTGGGGGGGGGGGVYGAKGGESPYQSFFSYHPTSLWQWAFLGLTFFQLLVCVGLECYIFAEFNQEIEPEARGPGNTTAETKAITIFLTIFIFGFLYQLLLVWDALRSRNTIQTFGVCIYNFALMVYSAIQPDQIGKALQYLGDRKYLLISNTLLYAKLKPFFIAIPIIIAVFTIAMSYVAWQLYREFAWVIYKHISADLRMKNRYLQFQIYIALLKFDFFFFLGFALQFIVLVLRKGDSEFPLSIAAVPFTVAFLVLAAVFTRKESAAGMILVIALYLAALAYYIFKLVRIYQPNITIYSSVRKSLASFAVLAIILILVTITYAIICTTNFKKGLKPHVQRRKKMMGRGQEDKMYGNEMGLSGIHSPPGGVQHQGGFGGYGNGGYEPGYGEMGKVPGVMPNQPRMTID